MIALNRSATTTITTINQQAEPLLSFVHSMYVCVCVCAYASATVIFYYHSLSFANTNIQHMPSNSLHTISTLHKRFTQYTRKQRSLSTVIDSFSMLLKLHGGQHYKHDPKSDIIRSNAFRPYRRRVCMFEGSLKFALDSQSTIFFLCIVESIVVNVLSVADRERTLYLINQRCPLNMH